MMMADKEQRLNGLFCSGVVTEPKAGGTLVDGVRRARVFYVMGSPKYLTWRRASSLTASQPLLVRGRQLWWSERRHGLELCPVVQPSIHLGGLVVHGGHSLAAQVGCNGCAGKSNKSLPALSLRVRTSGTLVRSTLAGHWATCR